MPDAPSDPSPDVPPAAPSAPTADPPADASLSRVLAQSPLSIALYDVAGRLVYGNAAFERHFGGRLADVPPDYSLLTDPQLAAVGLLPLVQRALAGEPVLTPPIEYDAGSVVGGARKVWTQGHAFPVRDAAGRVTHLAIVHVDVTAWAATERALRDVTTELQLRNRELEAQAAELQQANQQLQEQATELEAQAEELHVTAAQLEERTEAAEEAVLLAEQERARLDRIVGQLPAAVAVYEGPELRFRALSAAYARIVGGRPVLGRPIRQALPELAGQGFFELLERVYASGVPVAGSDVPASWDGDGDGVPEPRTVDFTYAPLLGPDARPEGVVALVLDVSERARLAAAERDARDAAEAAAARLALVLDSLPDAAAVLDDEWRYTLVNPAARALHAAVFAAAGAPPERVPSALGQVVWEIFPFLAGTKFETETRRAVRERRVVEYVEEIAPLGRWYETRVVPTESGVVLLNRDVTGERTVAVERERLLAAEREARAAAEVANQAKSDFLATMSHELRTPLNAIQGHLQLLELELHGPVTPPQREAFGRIDRAQRHLLGLIHDILSFARLESGRVEYDVQPVRVADVAQDVLPMVEPQLAAQGLTFSVSLADPADAEPLLVWADREKLGQILLNLLSNAIKFTPRGGAVAIALAARQDGSSPDDQVYVQVRDTGIGIPPDKLETVFEPFVQVRSAYSPGAGGTGLGLAISRDLARGMGGELRARSALGEGSTFTLALRRAVTVAGEPTDRRTGEERRIEEERRRRRERRREEG